MDEREKRVREKIKIIEQEVLKYEDWKEQAHLIAISPLDCVESEKAADDFLNFLRNPKIKKTRGNMIEFFEDYEQIPDEANQDDIDGG